MRVMKTMPNPISSITDEPVLPPLNKRSKDFITERLARGETPEWIAAGLRAYFEIEITPAQVIPYVRGELTPPTQAEPTQTEPTQTETTQTERRQDKESAQFPADEEKESLFTRLPDGETPQATPWFVSQSITSASASAELPQAPSEISHDSSQFSAAAGEEEEPTTQTGRRQNADSLQIPVHTVDEPTSRDNSIQALADLARARLGIAPDSAAATQTGPRPNPKNQNQKTVLTDEVKAFIVRGLARYETPTRVAASVQANFGIEIDRRQVFAYDPAGSRPPAQRWIELHAATRAKFMQATAEVGIAQKLVRLRMLERFANRADEHNQTERACKVLEQAAKECGGFYERYQRPKTTASPSN